VALKVFISYAKEDRESAERYYEQLAKEGASPWVDFKHLLPGQNWEAEIDRAFSDANVVVLLLSKRSVTKRGFVQREANDAIDRLRYKQPTDIYVIPLLLEPCEVPTHIASRLQYVDLNVPGAWDQVRAALRLASEQQSIELEHGVIAGPFNAFTERIEDNWEGLPGHNIEIEYPRFESSLRPDVAKELSALFAGRAYRSLIDARQKSWDQQPDFFKTRGAAAVNGLWENFVIVHSTDRFLSLTYDIGLYYAGAAHPNYYSTTYNFEFLDKVRKLEFLDFFSDPHGAVKRISEICIHELSKEYWHRTGETPSSSAIDSFKTGADEDPNHFRTFTVSADRFTFLFGYVSGYALGRWSVEVSFYELLGYLRENGPHVYASTQDWSLEEQPGQD